MQYKTWRRQAIVATMALQDSCGHKILQLAVALATTATSHGDHEWRSLLFGASARLVEGRFACKNSGVVEVKPFCL